ncbi:hypothetical protein ACFYZI_41450 [Streptomyces griseorubiginosus]|uniref:hypothetical protein n=1 Tax=Streptomyces griseorubiginosus TaxID=67304 RepID=UPI0036C460BB
MKQDSISTPHDDGVIELSTPATERAQGPLLVVPAPQEREGGRPSPKEQNVDERKWTYEPHVPVMGRCAWDGLEFVTLTDTGVRLENREEFSRNFQSRAAQLIRDGGFPSFMNLRPLPGKAPDVVEALKARTAVFGAWRTARIASPDGTASVDRIAAQVLVLPRSERWHEAVSTALAGPWSDPLWNTGELSDTALSALRAEARTLHRQLVPVWRRRTRHGRVLSLDADLGDGLSLYDLVMSDVGLLTHTAGGVFEDERLNALLRGLDPAERAVVFAYAEDDSTWTEAADQAGATDPEAFGERVRRKTKRLAAEQRRRTQQAYRPRPATGPAA